MDAKEAVEAREAKDLVRRGYDALSERYDRFYGGEDKYGPWLKRWLGELPPGTAVLDLGCGSGVPVARALDAAGHRVVGVDISGVQVSRAREAVPGATFIQADATAVSFPEAAFDAVIALYSLIHVPVAEQPALLASVARWLRPGGRLLCTMGHGAWTGRDEDWLGGGVPMWWSHADAATNRSWIAAAGLEVIEEEFVPEGDSGAVLFQARRP